MPIVNGTWVNWTTPTRANFTTIASTISNNLPWFWTAFLALTYFALFIIFDAEQGRKKFIVITVIPMVMSWIMVSFGLITPVIVDATTGIAILVTAFTLATG